jgi:hypothetical protein
MKFSDDLAWGGRIRVPAQGPEPEPEAPQGGMQREKWEAAFLKPTDAMGWKGGEPLPGTMLEWTEGGPARDPGSDPEPQFSWYRPMYDFEHRRRFGK